MKEWIHFFKKNPVFQTLKISDSHIQKLFRLISIQEFRKGAVIYRKGDSAESVFFVLSGEVGIFTEDINTKEKNINLAMKHISKEKMISIHGKGSIFGEVSFLAGETHSSSAIALTKTKIALIPGEIFLKFLEYDNQIAIKMIQLLSSRFRQRIGNEEAPHIGKIFSCLYPEIPERNFMMVRMLGWIGYREIQEPIVVIYFYQGWEKDLENQKQFLLLYENFEQQEITDLCEEITKHQKVIFLNAISLFKEEFKENKLIDFLSCLRRHFPVVFIETPSFDYPISKVFVRICDQILFFEKFGTTAIALRDLYIEQLIQEKLIHREKVIYIYECSINEKVPIEQNQKEVIYYLKTFISKELEPQEDRSLRRFVRILFGNSKGLALGGGARAFAHIGCLEVFESEQIEFDAVIGSSMGAIIGALYCMGIPVIEIRKTVEKYLPRSEVVLDKTLPIISFFGGKKLNRLLDEVFKDLRIEELEIPFYCNATDLITGKLVLFERGFIDFALRCSVSLPGVYPPIKYGEYVLVDGSVLNNLPGEILKEKGYSKILGINVTPLVDPVSSRTEVSSEKGIKGVYEYYSLPPILNIINRSIAIQGRELLKYQLQHFDFILHPDVAEYGLFDFHLRDLIIERGIMETRKRLSEIKEIFLEL